MLYTFNNKHKWIYLLTLERFIFQNTFNINIENKN